MTSAALTSEQVCETGRFIADLQRDDGTLRAYYRHRVHAEPLLWPGLQDITASVDFTALAEAGTNAGFDLSGYATQAVFLLGNGLDALLEQESAREHF